MLRVAIAEFVYSHWLASKTNELVNKFLAFVEPNGSFPCSQELASIPYPEPDVSNPHPPNLFL
jgi:hypothetical protein